jgi:exosortase A-associated hydrolase 2
MTSTPVLTQPFFMDVPEGRLYAVYRRPDGPVRGNVLCVPPFNEEMNRCRSMVTLQANALAELGFGTLLVDLIGTGDSTGEYRDGRWPLWLNNVRAGMAWLDSQPGGCTLLWGIRLGAMLAAEIQGKLARPDLGLILWQPLLEGKIFFTQFLRLRLAAQMNRTDVPKETTAFLRAQFARGENVEISGYEIHPELAHALDAARLDALVPARGAPVLWLEHVPAGGEGNSPASQKVLDIWSAAGVVPDVRTFEGPQFWQVHERVVAHQAITQTANWVAERVPT